MKLASSNCGIIQFHNVAICGVPPLWERRRYKIRTRHLLFNSCLKFKGTRCRHWWFCYLHFFCL